MTPYEELTSPTEMHADCQAVGRNLRLEQAARRVSAPVPSIHYSDFPREVAKRDIQISAAAVHLANALHLHLD